ncbi:MAG TPA: ATP-binding protein [Kofleriaceae bacterium]|nr:ATP-binding protein [Kofleriaceae bacterium]
MKVALLPAVVALALQLALWRVLGSYGCLLFYPATIIATWRLVSASHSKLQRAVEDRRMFAALVDGSPDFIGMVDVQRRPRYLNPAGRRLVGLGLDEPIDEMSILDYFPPEARESVEANLETAATRARWQGEIEMQSFATGARIAVSQIGFTIHDPDTGQYLGMATIARDISAMKQLERELRELSRDLNRAQAVAGVGSWRYDAPSQSRVWSDETLRILGVRPGTQLNAETFFSLVHPDDRAYVESRWAAALVGKQPYDIEHRIVVAGETRWVHAKADTEVDANGALQSAIGTIQDITEIKRNEAGQRLLADVGTALAGSLDYEQTLANLADVVVRELADFCIVDIIDGTDQGVRIRAACRNPADTWICEVLARAARERGQPYFASDAFATKRPVFVREISQSAIVADAADPEHARALRGLDARSIIAVPLIAAGALLGAIVLVASRASPGYGSNDLRFAEQLAHRAALAIENARLYLAAQGAIRSRDEVLGVVAHDLRNPLNAITLSAELIDHQAVPARHKSAETIVRAAKRMNRLIEDLLDVTRLEGGKLSLDRTRVATPQLLADSVEAQRPLATAAALDLRVDVAPDVPAVWADRDRLLQILENLIGNALKFTARGGYVAIGAAARGHDVLFWVADCGSGIAQADQPHVFDRFWQAGWMRKRGAGLGLPIAKGLVEAHGGRIWLESKLGRGTTVFFTIPSAAQAETHTST